MLVPALSISCYLDRDSTIKLAADLTAQGQAVKRRLDSLHVGTCSAVLAKSGRQLGIIHQEHSWLGRAILGPNSIELMCAWVKDIGALQTVSAPADRSVLGTGMERGPEPLVPAVPAVDLLLDGSAALCACLSGDGSSSIIGLHLPAILQQV